MKTLSCKVFVVKAMGVCVSEVGFVEIGARCVLMPLRRNSESWASFSEKFRLLYKDISRRSWSWRLDRVRALKKRLSEWLHTHLCPLRLCPALLYSFSAAPEAHETGCKTVSVYEKISLTLIVTLPTIDRLSCMVLIILQIRSKKVRVSLMPF